MIANINMEESGKSSAVAEAEAGTSGLIEANSSRRFIRKDGEDSLISEEANRLAQLDFSLEVQPQEPIAELGEQEREHQYKKLVDLLSKSSFYTNVLRKKVEAARKARMPKKRKTDTSSKNGDDNLESGSPKRICTPPEQTRSPSTQNSSPSKQLCSPSKQIGSPSKQHSSLSIQFAASPMECSSPSKQMNSPSKQIGSPSKQIGSPSKQIGSPSKQIGSPSKQTMRRRLLEENKRVIYQVASEIIKNEETKKVEYPSTTLSPSTAVVRPAVKIQQPKLLSGGTLRDYQLEGFNWLKMLHENGVNGILADEMGLGKTIQVIALLCHLVGRKITGPSLIVGPLSTLPNWMIEFERFAPQLHVKLFYGNKHEREDLKKSVMRREKVNGVMCYPIIVTSYETPIFERRFMQKIKWKYIIVDEGHRIKNYNAILSKVLRTFESSNRLLLTGTPLQNSLSELWSLLNFLVPEIFDNLEVFESWFRIEELSDDAGRKKILEEERRKNVLSTLHQILAPFMLRREKSEVTLDIPKKKEVVVQVPMTDMQLKLYQAVLERNFEILRKLPAETPIIDGVNGKRPKRSCTLGKNYKEISEGNCSHVSLDNAPQIRSDDVEAIATHFIRVRMQAPTMSPMKQIASHPYLVHYPLEEDGVTYKIDESVVKSSGKFLVLDAMLEKLYARGHKVLLFSTLCLLLTIVEDYLSLRPAYAYERLDGSVQIEDRKDSIQRFNSDPNIFLFLISTRAGGLGINLTGADTVIILDSDWNPQVDLQAQDRCHRIGQTKPVMVYRMVTMGTMEERVLERAGAKRILEKMVIQKGVSMQNLEELKVILESRDHSEIVCPDGQAVFTEEQLEKLLDRSDMYN